MKQLLMTLLVTMAIALQAHAQVTITSYSSAAAPELILCEQEGDSVFFAWQSEQRHTHVYYRYGEDDAWIEGSVIPMSLYFTTEIHTQSHAILHWRITSGNTPELQECVEGYVRVATDTVDAEPPHYHPSW